MIKFATVTHLHLLNNNFDYVKQLIYEGEVIVVFHPYHLSWCEAKVSKIYKNKIKLICNGLPVYYERTGEGNFFYNIMPLANFKIIVIK